MSKDHIDWHGSWKEYVKSKIRIFKNQDKKCYAIICIDDKNCQQITETFNENFKSKLIRISTQKKINDGIYLKEKNDNLIIVNNLDNSKIQLEKTKLKFTNVKHNYQNLFWHRTHVNFY